MVVICRELILGDDDIDDEMNALVDVDVNNIMKDRRNTMLLIVLLLR